MWRKGLRSPLCIWTQIRMAKKYGFRLRGNSSSSSKTILRTPSKKWNWLKLGVAGRRKCELPGCISNAPFHVLDHRLYSNGRGTVLEQNGPEQAEGVCPILVVRCLEDPGGAWAPSGRICYIYRLRMFDWYWNCCSNDG